MSQPFHSLNRDKIGALAWPYVAAAWIVLPSRKNGAVRWPMGGAQRAGV